MIHDMQSGDPDTLDRFLAAQDGVCDKALAELRRGRKQSHWMWFIFPQLRGLGRSAMAHRYGIVDLDEARRYLGHPVLGPRLSACGRAMLDHRDESADTILGPVDAAKLRSSATLFAAAGGDPRIFDDILTAFFGGRPCPLTLERLAR
ncbi:DUF1810 domain-containing protein [Paracoccus sediminis]|uniref:Uncharacterized protein, DUF1810 family n=2 Tax=Paracoccus sediminis TaxID=1214787 RepID=A0A238W800_9RHOB|nr:DUF1810 domain-containing protein [Paracoccus sediminis]SNR42638.1 Uncharacterized protein, DUF1810 family [Paracoccus sediminis]